jgi:tRNA(Arg) A34 adenosine deaminase TadA
MEKVKDTAERYSYFTRERDVELMRKCNEVAIRSINSGSMPFGAILVDDKGVVLLEQTNDQAHIKDCTAHAETALARKASGIYEPEFLWNCSLYTTVEPCVMCTGAIYWGNIGRIVYGLEEAALLEMTGDDDRNPTFNIPCRTIVMGGQKDMVVVGPIDEVADEIVEGHKRFW